MPGSGSSTQLCSAKKNAEKMTELLSQEPSLDPQHYPPTQGPGYGDAQVLVWVLTFQVWHLEPATLSASQSGSCPRLKVVSPWPAWPCGTRDSRPQGLPEEPEVAPVSGKAQRSASVFHAVQGDRLQSH